MFKASILVEAGNWKKEVPGIEKILNKNFKKIFSSLKKFNNKNLEVSILLTDKKNMKQLNKKFRKISKDTDVLSFPNYEKIFFSKNSKIKNLYLGDLAFSYDYIKKQKTDFLEYINKIFIHGCLHLIGYEHNNLKNYKAMSLVEKKLLIKI
jgi:probable rRNA maturation factor